ncbi:dephospho-CoA kinase [Roseateles sp. BYS180W]|uniref:Dephospho-CoA kinase n=1 Tax=Roseateles rivi TaxID=3299028 RepID=A0ABW7FRF2_9BURK
MSNSARRIGLTGGIGSGKSTVARLLTQLGALLIDTDAIARSLTQAGGAAIAPLREQLGERFIAPDGALDRAAVRERVFQDPQAKRQLEAVLHPLILAECDARAAAAPAHQRLVFDVPLLAESVQRWRARVDRIVVVDCSEATQVQRVMARSGWTQDAVQAVIAQQASRAQRLAIADDVIANDGLSLDALQAHVLALWQRWNLNN